MGKKLLFLVILLIAFLLPTSVMAQCPSSVSISANPGTTVCSGTSVTFTATPTSGTNLSYEWFIGSASTQSSTSNTFSSTSLNNSDKIKVIVTSSNDTSCTTESNILTMTVNPVLTPSVSISASKTNICPGENITFTASPINGGNNPMYIWKVNGTNSGTGNSFSTTSLTNGQSVTAELTSNAICASSSPVTSSAIPITVKAAEPATPGAITGDAQVCPGIPLTYSIAAVANATSYEWTLPSGWTGASTSNSISATSGNTGNGTISVKAKNDCGTSAAITLAVTVSDGTPNTPGTITGDAQVCPGISKTYSIAAVAGATEYEWTLPSGWNGSSTTNSINVTTGASGNGNITVKAKNYCGTSAAKTLAVSVKPGTPATPSTISGATNICPGTTNTYSIAAVSNATSYEWILPNGWTGTSTTTSINATSTSTGGAIKVKAINDCGTSTEQTLAITIKSGTPSTPVNLSGSNTVCPNTSEIYSVTNDATATEYIWTLPNGWTGTSSTSSITVNTGTSGSGNITVKAKNECGTSVAAAIAVSVKAPAPIMSGVISGNNTVCHNATGLLYSIPAITNATSYVWSLPSGWSITSGLHTNSITVSAGTTDGSINVIAKNDCGDSAASANFAVTSTDSAPGTPGTITSNLTANAICPPATGITFNVPSIVGATDYTWTLPSGWEITSGAGSNSIIVRVNATAATTNNATVSVTANNLCGSGPSTSLSGIAVASHVVVNAGTDITACTTSATINIEGTYSFGTSNANLKPKWTSLGSGSFGNDTKLSTTYTPSTAELTSGKATLTLTTDAPSGACGPGKDEIVIFFKPDPTANISGTSTICTGNATDITFTGTANTTVTYKKNGGADQTMAIGASGTAILNTGVLTASTTYTLVSVRYTAAPNCPKTITGSAVVTITPKPTATITYGASPYSKCLSTDQSVTLTGTGAYQGGTYSAPTGLTVNPSTGSINPSTSTAGTYTVTYTTPASGGCAAVAVTTDVTIVDVPTITLSYAGTPFCTDNVSTPTPTLGGTGAYQGGSYSAENGLVVDSASGAINIASSTPGSYNVVYSVTPATGCTPITQSTPVIITEKPQPSISYSATEYCKSVNTAQAVVLTQTGTATITGGNYTSSPAGLSLDTNGALNPSLSDAGNYTITYSLDAASGCEAITTETTVSITEIPSAEISYAGPFCQSDATAKVVSFNNTVGAYQGGTFSGTAGLTIDSETGAITPSTSQSSAPGLPHTVTYTIPASAGCEAVDITTTVTITSAPTAILSYNGPFCTSETSPQAVTFSNTAGDYQNGTFSGTNGLSIDANGNIDPSTSSPGSHTVSYTILGANGCEENLITTDVEILEQVVITTQPSNVGICSTQAAEFEVIASGSNLTYQWYKDGSLLSGKTSSILSFNNATSINSGEYYVIVSGTSPCSSATSETVTLNVDEEIIIIKPAEDETFCENDVTEITFEYIAHANGAPLTFEWIKDNVVLTDPTKYTFERSGPTGATGEYSGKITINNLAVSDNGAYAVQIKGPDSFTCSEATSKTFTLSINDQPDAPSTEDLSYCQGDTASALTATGTNLKWYATETGDDLIAGTPTPSTTAVGATSYWVSQTPNECESPRAELTVTIKEKPAKPTTTETLSFCLNEVVTTALEAVGDTGNTVNWYSAIDATTPLGSAPIPNTSTDVTTSYWVSQTKDGCESDRAKVTITINPLPILTVHATDATICSGSSTTLNTSGATTYLWTVNGNAIEPAAESTKASPTVSPTATTTYLVTGTSDKGCISTAEVTVNVDEQSIGGFITPSSTSVCVSGNSGTLSITGSGYLGAIQRWESSINGGASWTSIPNTSETLSFSNLPQSTSYRVAIKNGVCTEVFSGISEITVDPVPIGGKLLFNNNERIYLTCESPSASSLSPISISEHSGTIVAWKYRKSTAGSWTTIQESGSDFTGTTLSASQIFGLGVTETIVFQVEMSSGSCTPNALSQTAILSVIPSDIEPTPVTIDPDVLCFGEEVTLTSSTGYTDRPNFLDQGAFDNASITNHGWRVRRNGSSTDIGFDTDANNTRPDRWKRATRHQFTTANINSPYNTREDLYISSGGEGASGNKGFAIVSSNNSATLETPVFAIGGLDQAILTWDQMYNLTPGASIKVEISTDGGNTYNNVLYSVSTQPDPTNTTGVSSGNFDGFSQGTIATSPNNKIQVDLGYYMGQQNLRIRFSYVGLRLGDVWAIDNIDIPDGPRGVELAWYDYTDELNPIFIGNDETETWTPTKIGWNEFEVRTKLLLDSSGQACQSIENYERVEAFAFDKYVSTAISTAGSCGSSIVQLNGKIEGIGTVNGGTPQGEITSFPTLDGYNAAWVVTGPSGYVFSESHFTSENGISPASKDPNAFFEPGLMGTYSLTWTLTPTAVDENNILIPNDGCPPDYTPVEIGFVDCTTLDFDGIDDFADLGTDYTSAYSIEAWFRPEATSGTIISKRDGSTGNGFDLSLNNGKLVFSWNAGVLTAPQSIAANERWYHAAVSFNGSTAELFIDGISVASHAGGAYINSTAPVIIGALHDSSAPFFNSNHFSGWIEEVRIWNTAITEKQVQFMMNQRLYNNGAQMGVEIPMDVPEGLTYNNLAGYYQLIATDILTGGLTADLATTSVNGILHNMETLQENTAPLPYTSRIDGQTWATDNTWTHFDVWDAPNSNGVDGTPIDWNIVRASHDIKSGGKDITVLGLLSDTPGKMLSIANPSGAQDETNNGQFIRVTHYLHLDGNMDLVGESQLLQDEGSLLAEASAGYLERDQQGTLSSFNYNYWTAPVSTQGAANNSGFTVGNIMWDGTDSKNPKAINYKPGHPAADGAKTNPITKSDYWIFKFANKLADDYDSWQHIGSTGVLKTGEGHTMKGVSGVGGVAAIAQKQNYVYRGKPNNGNITLTIDKERNYLVGNPYPSAIDSKKFILDNLNSATVAGATNNRNIFDGTLYFWDHFSGATHILREYIGGYAVLNLTGGAPAIATDDRINSTAGVSPNTPEQFIPVSQGFFVNTGTEENISGGVAFTLDGGPITFKNSQRVFARESSGNSIFLRPENITKSGKEETKSLTPKIRISFKSPKGYNRQLLVGADANTTNGFDIGYDAPMIEYNLEDMYWLQGGNFLVIQGVPDFGKDQVLPLGVRIDKVGEFRIKIDTLENINNDHTIYLKDKVLDTIHDIRSGPYLATSEAGEITDRFQLIFFKESQQDPIIEDPIIIDDLTDISLLHSYIENEMMVLNPKELSISAIYLFDLNGKLLSVFDDIPSEKEINLKIANFSEGIYILRMHTDNEIVTRKIIIK